MELLNAYIGWNGKNHEAIIEYKGETILATANGINAIKKAIKEAAEFHFEDEDLDYQIDYVLRPSALVRNAAKIVKIRVIAEYSGINEKRLAHYSQGRREGNEETRQKIAQALYSASEDIRAVV